MGTMPSPQLLIDAARNGDHPTVSKLLATFKSSNYGPRWLNNPDKFGWSALHHAAFQGHALICRDLIVHGADSNLRTERGNETPLFLAAAVDQPIVIETLLSLNADPNIVDITGKIPLEVSSGQSEEILSQEHLKHGKIYRFLPTIRKLLASKFLQFLLQLLLCVFLELFQESLMEALHKTTHLVLLLGPRVQQIIVGVFDRMLAPTVMRLSGLLKPLFLYFVIPCTQFLSHYFGPIFATFCKPLVIILINTVIVFGRGIWFPFSIGFSLFSWCGGFLWMFVSTFWSSFLFLWKTLWMIFQEILGVFFTAVQSTTLYISIAKFLADFMFKVRLIVWNTLQPKQLAAKLVSPIILGASKLLYLFPSTWVNAIERGYMHLAGKSRHISDEEVATVSLLIVGLGLYVIGIVLGGYLLRVVLYFLYQKNLYGSELEYLREVFVVFNKNNYLIMNWKPDGSLHELGLIFVTIVIPPLIFVRLGVLATRYTFYGMKNLFENQRSPRPAKRNPRKKSLSMTKVSKTTPPLPLPPDLCLTSKLSPVQYVIKNSSGIRRSNSWAGVSLYM